MRKPKILILTVPHGASHRGAADALRHALCEIEAGLTAEVADALEHCAPWFRAYYNSYEIPLKHTPRVWGWIEAVQHQSSSTGPGWLYRRGARPLFRFIDNFGPDIVIATEVGVCELAAIDKRENHAAYRLVAIELMDFNRAWVQPEVDLYLVTHEDLGAELAAAGAAHEKIFCSGQPIHRRFATVPPPDRTRERLGLEPGIPALLVLFGGTGFGKPRRIVSELRRLQHAVQLVFIAGRNKRLEEEVRRCTEGMPHTRVLGWADNVQDWMVACDLAISKPGGSTLAEGFACGLPMLAYDPLPGNEQRTCAWIEKWGVGRWIRRSEDLAPAIDRLIGNRSELDLLRARAKSLARPRAAYDGAQQILKLWRDSSNRLLAPTGSSQS
ncbi:MAG TPA: glycosyltransferase [Terriglobia bacterium]|nr:glycosyltransferase [Terriglobia bacterium]